MMTITHRATDASAASLAEAKPEKAPRLACCCKLSDLLPIVRQLHEKARTQAPQSAERPAAA